MKNGIAISGTALVDRLNEITSFPQIGQLTQIKKVSKAVGGCVPNVGIDLKKIDKNLKVVACAKVGNDADGKFLIEELSKNGLDVSGVVVSKNTQTSFTDVMSIVGGERTFFTYAGACADYGLSDMDFDSIDVKMLHLGYFLLLDAVDNGEGLKILKEAKEKGIKTSIDLVSENSDRYGLIVPCLKYVDNLIINEIEASSIVGIEPKNENIKTIAEKLKELGVKERVIIHMPEKGICLSNSGYTEVMSYKLPKGYIKGTTGAGDAFCAGSLYGIYNDYTDKEILEFGSMCAVMALSESDAVSGMKDKERIYNQCKNLRRKTI